MKKMIIAIIILAALPLAAQPVFTEEDLPNIGYEGVSVIDTADAILVDVGSTGGPHAWDFSREVQGLTQTFRIISTGGTPAEDSFPAADFVQYVNGWANDTTPAEIWNYVQTSPTEVLGLGDYLESELFGEPLYFFHDYDPDRMISTLPLQMGEAWQDSFYRADSLDPLGTIWNEIVSVSHELVDAWGTAIVPAGSFPVLRTISYDTTLTVTWMFGIPDSTMSCTIEYTWVAADVGAVAYIVSENDETDPAFNEAQNYVVLDSCSEIAVAENLEPELIPAIGVIGNGIFFSINQSGNVELDIYDASGCRTNTLYRGNLSAGEHSLALPADLVRGVYFIRMRQASKNVSAKFVVLD